MGERRRKREEERRRKKTLTACICLSVCLSVCVTAGVKFTSFFRSKVVTIIYMSAHTNEYNDTYTVVPTRQGDGHERKLRIYGLELLSISLIFSKKSSSELCMVVVRKRVNLNKQLRIEGIYSQWIMMITTRVKWRTRTRACTLARSSLHALSCGFIRSIFSVGLLAAYFVVAAAAATIQ